MKHFVGTQFFVYLSFLLSTCCTQLDQANIRFQAHLSNSCHYVKFQFESNFNYILLQFFVALIDIIYFVV